MEGCRQGGGFVNPEGGLDEVPEYVLRGFEFVEDAFSHILPVRVDVDDEKRNVVGVGLHAARHDIAEAGPRCDDDDRRSARGSRVSVGHEDEIGLMAGGNRFDVLVRKKLCVQAKCMQTG